MSEEEKTTIEFGGVSFTGGKAFAFATALSTLGGATWGGFEFYNDYRNMKTQIEEYVAPDMSGIEQTLAVQRETITSLQTTMTEVQSKVADVKEKLNEDLDKIEELARRVDDNTATTQRELRDDVYSIETKVNERMRTLDEDMRALRKDIEEKIQTILDNPLNN